MNSRIRCAQCDGNIKFVPYTSLDFPGKSYCCVHCLCKYEQAKMQYDRSLQLQPVLFEDEEGDRCYCGRCTDDD